MRILSAIIVALGCTRIASAFTYDGSSSSSSLAQQALQKVIKDASEIFGPPQAFDNSSSGGNSSRSSWMSAYPDTTPLTLLNIPGLHDAATWNYSAARQDELRPIADLLNTTLLDNRAYRCQQAPIVAALAAGVRFLDLRYAAGPLGTFAGSAPGVTTLSLWHNEALLAARADLEAVLFAVLAWLDAHPSETVLLSLQYEGSTTPTAANDAAVQAALLEVLSSPAARDRLLRIPAGADHGLGTLGAARGKVLLVRRFDLDRLPAAASDGLPGVHLSPADWTDNSPDIAIVYDATTNATAYVEDLYEPSDSIALSAPAGAYVAAKMDAVAAHLRKAAADATGSFFITFASGERLAADVPVFPQTLALGNGTDVTPDGGVNQQLLSLLRGELRGERLGVVVLDFWDEPGDLVDVVLGL